VGDGTSQEGLALASPFTGMRYSFGMLLGVEDFEAVQAYLRGKTWLHNGWLHGAGVVWGLRVTAPEIEGRPGERNGEIAVDPGLALDAVGHELYLDGRWCVDVGRWLDAHRDDPALDLTTIRTGVRFSAHVIARFRACLARPIPAMAQPCEGADVETAYSRTLETLVLELRPGPAPDALRTPSARYPRLRVLFGLAAPATTPAELATRDAAVTAEMSAIAAAAPADRAAMWLAAFRRFAALDAMDLQPVDDPDGLAAAPFPATDSPPVLLADVRGITLDGRPGAWSLSGLTIDATVRPTLVATSTLQELLTRALNSASAAPPPPPPPGPADAGGPRFDRASVTLGARQVSLGLTTGGPALLEATVDPAAFDVTTFADADGWSVVDIRRATLDAGGRVVTLDLRETLGGDWVRVVARGTGPTPLLGANHVPLAGAADAPAGSTHDGHDFVHLQPRS